jgi:hypothetical protein
VIFRAPFSPEIVEVARRMWALAIATPRVPEYHPDDGWLVKNEEGEDVFLTHRLNLESSGLGDDLTHSVPENTSAAGYQMQPKPSRPGIRVARRVWERACSRPLVEWRSVNAAFFASEEIVALIAALKAVGVQHGRNGLLAPGQPVISLDLERGKKGGEPAVRLTLILPADGKPGDLRGQSISKGWELLLATPEPLARAIHIGTGG